MRETAGIPGDVTQSVSLDRSVGVGDVAPVMGGDPTPVAQEFLDAGSWPETRVDGVTSVYGPQVTESRAAEVATLMRWFGLILEQLAAERALSTDCIIVGRDAWVETLAVGLCMDPMLTYRDLRECGSVCMGVMNRRELALRLDALGRPDDALKVRRGPPDACPHPRARLLVCCADASCLAVTWSKGWRVVDREDF